MLPKELVKYSPKYRFSRLMNFPRHGSRFRPVMNSVVVSIHSGARPNNRSYGSAAYAVSFGDKPCVRDMFDLLDEDLPQTQHRAILEALDMCLDTFHDMVRNDDIPFGRPLFVIKTNSETLIRSMDEWIWDWVENGGYKKNGKEVEHWDLIEKIHETICYLESDFNATVRFWKVDREDISDAVSLMRDALDD